MASPIQLPDAEALYSTLREKLFGEGPLLPDNHPAARYRDIEAVKREQAAHAAAEERFLYAPMLMDDRGIDSARHALAEARQRSALGSVEAMRIEAGRKVRNLVVIEPPTRPERAEYPHAAASLLTLLLSCVVLYGIVRLTVATVQEHRD
mgnify:CR=1 FL=1